MEGSSSLSTEGPSVYTPFLRRFTDNAARDLNDTIALYHDVRRMHQGSAWSNPDIADVLADKFMEMLPDVVTLPDHASLLESLITCLKAVISKESTLVSFPEIDWSRARLSMKEQVDLNRFLRAKQHFLAN